MQFTYFGLYFFVFLLTESLINERAVTVFGAANVNYIYAIGLIFTALGYLAFSTTKNETNKKNGIIFESIAFLSIIGTIEINASIPFLLFSYICLFSLGYIGGLIHFETSLELTRKNFSLYLGISSMFGIILQFITQNIGLSNNEYLIVIELVLVFIVLLSLHNKSDNTPKESVKMSKITISVRTWVYIVSVTIMSIILGFQDSIIVIKNANGELELFSYVRLFYALGLLVAGIIANIRNRVYLPLASGCAMTLSVLAMSFLRDTNTLYNVSMGIMYFYCGFYVMFMTVMFMELGLRRNNPRLYAGLGRVVRSITTCIVVLVTTVLSNCIGENIYTILSCVLSIGLLVFMALSGVLVPEKSTKKEEGILSSEIQLAEKLKEIYTQYGFTPKEIETFEKLVTTEMGVQEIADEMGISRRVLQRHISAIYEKTETKTRAGLFILLNR
ncbi:MAG: hypothetical protein Q4D29_06790 [Lachnospiraceae bacterium]|nr:hypothetical protein [Lachnospiraceae bacterium]